MQYARVPIELVELVDMNALALYVALCAYARREGGKCWPSNPELSDRLGVSEATIRRALKQLVDVGVVERRGRQRRVLTVVPLERLSLTTERKDDDSIAHHRATYRSPVSDGTRRDQPEITPSLRDAVTDHESEQQMSTPDEPMFEIERVERPKPTAQAAVAAFVDAYGDAPISRTAIARIAQRMKQLSATYSHDELVAAAVELGTQRIANPNAIEPFVLRARQPRHVAQQRRSQWSALASDTLAQLPSPFNV